MERISFTIFLTLLLFSCNSNKQDKFDTFKTLTDMMSNNLPNANYTISIPADYTIVESRAGDFSVYYIKRKNSANKSGFNATMYIGNHPSKFPVVEKCKLNNKNSIILQNNVLWEIYSCKDDFFTQTFSKNKFNHGWDQMIHAAGRSKSRAGVDTILYIFSTLKPKK
ncbi:hypothetical protein FPZ43_04640 [Mucilaginibacter pallidiroseus]|uniref:Uncharacterized protein n=1 Tax=Mucilaginibacter pallidiroseus TaxID=2599295 RepID=A0A563UFU1_9SPHI|nr:hypothetical protein [Mucilaginibacter pallidiroseus]TWR30235.1 hypothetical protein FPZ43_04640 [Mucilaginibacter pallidiroseus]